MLAGRVQRFAFLVSECDIFSTFAHTRSYKYGEAFAASSSLSLPSQPFKSRVPPTPAPIDHFAFARDAMNKFSFSYDTDSGDESRRNSVQGGKTPAGKRPVRKTNNNNNNGEVPAAQREAFVKLLSEFIRCGEMRGCHKCEIVSRVISRCVVSVWLLHFSMCAKLIAINQQIAPGIDNSFKVR